MSDKPVIVLGGGGHGRVLIDLLQLTARPILGICDPQLAAGAGGPMGIAVLGDDDAVLAYSRDDIELVNGIGSTKTMTLRHTVYRRFGERGFRFATLLHPSAVVARGVRLDEGAQIMAGAVLQCGASIGANSIVNTRASVDHDCTIGQTVHIAPGVTLSGNVGIGDRTHVGTAAIIIQSVRVGEDCLVPAGALVTRDVPDGTRLRTSGGSIA
ncbi:MAG TPA: acetyltransferase [Stellaceae bacterium]|jgi:UDP-perosamine 4-acetyltransferase